MDEILRQELAKAKKFLETQGKCDNAYYKLYSVQYVNSSYGKSDLKAQNFSSGNLEESLESLEHDMRSYGDTSKEFWVLKNYNTKNDPQPVEVVLKNAFFNPNNHKGSASNNSINGMNNSINGQYIEMMREHYTTINNLKEKHLEFEHKIELREKEREIEALQDAKRGKLDAINDFVETPIGSQLALMLMQFMNVNMAGGKNIQVQQPQQQYQNPEPQPERKNDSNINQEQEIKVMKVQSSINRFEKTFGDEGIDMLEELSKFCAENPMIAQQMLQKKRENG